MCWYYFEDKKFNFSNIFFPKFSTFHLIRAFQRTRLICQINFCRFFVDGLEKTVPEPEIRILWLRTLSSQITFLAPYSPSTLFLFSLLWKGRLRSSSFFNKIGEKCEILPFSYDCIAVLAQMECVASVEIEIVLAFLLNFLEFGNVILVSNFKSIF